MANREKAALTELEGAVLTEIAHRGNRTSFQVRRAFQTSPSSSWSGSAGAVYPAINRLEVAGLVVAQAPTSGRGTRLLSLSPDGNEALKAWFCDPDRACSIGADPFRLRAGLWDTLSPVEQRRLVETLSKTLDAELSRLRSREALDPVERVGNNLAIRLQLLRKEWLRELESRSPVQP